jgi:hypothetical protein
VISPPHLELTLKKKTSLPYRQKGTKTILMIKIPFRIVVVLGRIYRKPDLLSSERSDNIADFRGFVKDFFKNRRAGKRQWKTAKICAMLQGNPEAEEDRKRKKKK